MYNAMIRRLIIAMLMIISFFLFWNKKDEISKDDKVMLPIPQKKSFDIDKENNIILKNGPDSLYIDTKDLSMYIKKINGKKINISSGIGDIKLTYIESEEDGVSFYISEYDIKSQVKFKDNIVDVSFKTSKIGNFSWPNVELLNKDYICMPLYFGYQIPIGDRIWESYLVESSPIKTMEKLSMPFWTVLKDGLSMTYIMDNPQDNKLYFAKSANGMFLRLEHEFNRILRDRRFGFKIIINKEDAIVGAKEYRKKLIEEEEFISIKEKIKKTSSLEKLLGAFYIIINKDVDDKQIKRLNEYIESNKIDRLWIGSYDWKNKNDILGYINYKNYISSAIESYSRIKKEEEADLYENGAILDKDGLFIEDENGRLLNPIISMDYAKKYMEDLMSQISVSSIFIAEEKNGLLYDDYSKLHRMNKQEDLNSKKEKINWLKQEFGVLVGSNNQKYYAPMINDFVQFEIEEDQRYKNLLFGSYKYKLPLYQMVFNDSVLIASEIDEDFNQIDQILDCIFFNNSPLIFFDRDDLEKKDPKSITWAYKDLSIAHRKLSLLYIKEFEFLNPEKTLKRINYQDKYVMVANYSNTNLYYKGINIPSKSILIRNLIEDFDYIYSPK